MIDRIALYVAAIGVLILLFFGSLDIDVSDEDKGRGSAPVVSTL